MKLPLAAIWKKYKLVLLVAAVGVVLMLLPGGKQTQSAQAETDTRGTYSLEETERRMETLLGKISGTGQLSLMLTVQSGAELELAEDTDADERGQRRETVTLGRGAERRTSSSRGSATRPIRGRSSSAMARATRRCALR